MLNLNQYVGKLNDSFCTVKPEEGLFSRIRIGLSKFKNRIFSCFSSMSSPGIKAYKIEFLPNEDIYRELRTRILDFQNLNHDMRQDNARLVKKILDRSGNGDVSGALSMMCIEERWVSPSLDPVGAMINPDELQAKLNLLRSENDFLIIKNQVLSTLWQRHG